MRQALLMQTGLEFDNSTHTQSLYETTGSSIAYVLQRPLQYPPGVVTHYNDGAPHLVSAALAVQTGLSLEAYAQQRLWAPLGIQKGHWEAAQDGTTFGAFSLYLTSRDLGKLGQLLLQGGIWEGQRLIDSAYLAEATQLQTAANFHGEPYGYYFWILPAIRGYCASGHGGQFLLVVPERQLVAVYTAAPYTDRSLWDEREELFTLLVKSCL